MGKMLNNFAKERRKENMLEYNFYFKRIKRMILSMFKWEGLPKGITSQFIEKILFENGFIIFYKSKGGFLKVSRASAHGLNIYDEPTYFKPLLYGDKYSDDGFIRAENCVCVYNDVLKEGNSANAHFFSKKLSAIDKVIDCNMEHLKIPFIISCSEGQVKTIEIMLEKKNNGEPYILANDEMTNINTKLWGVDIKNNVPELEEEKRIILNDALTFFGINNVNISKKERLISGETDANDEEININLNSMFQERVSKIDDINKKFATNISVKINKKSLSEIEEICSRK